MIECNINEEMLEIANKRSQAMGSLKNSITKGEGNIAGFVGEMAVQFCLGGTIDDKRNYDIKFSDNSTADVKTKRCKSKPELHYECSISDYNTMQKCDKYIFVRVLNNYKIAWILGWMNKEEYFKKSNFIYKGQFDPTNNWRAKCDCWNLSISNLNKFENSQILNGKLLIS